MSVEKYGSIADTAAQKYGVPIPIFRSLINTESGWNPQALGKSGDSGLTQLTPRIYKYLGVNPWNPQQNLEGGAKFLSELYGKYKNWDDALAHYNAGFNLKNGRSYAEKVLRGAGNFMPEGGQVVQLIKNQSFTPILDAAKRGDDPTKIAAQTQAETMAIKDESTAEKILTNISTWFEKRAKSFAPKIVLFILVIILLYLSVTRLIK